MGEKRKRERRKKSDTQGNRVGPGGIDKTLAVKSRKNT